MQNILNVFFSMRSIFWVKKWFFVDGGGWKNEISGKSFLHAYYQIYQIHVLGYRRTNYVDAYKPFRISIQIWKCTKIQFLMILPKNAISLWKDEILIWNFLYGRGYW